MFNLTFDAIPQKAEVTAKLYRACLPDLPANLSRAFEAAHMAYNRSTDAQSAANWYECQNARLQAIADSTGYSMARVACVVAALSPSCAWEQNLRDAHSVLSTAHADNVRVFTYGANKDKAYAIKLAPEGDIFAFFSDKSPKTRAFAHNLLLDPEHVTIDVWMLRALFNLPANCQTTVKVPTVYQALEALVAQFGAAHGFTGYQMQAYIWTAIRTVAARANKRTRTATERGEQENV